MLCRQDSNTLWKKEFMNRSMGGGQMEMPFDLPDDLLGTRAESHSFRTLERPLWTEQKASLISRYLYYFVLITKHGVYIDGFAGPQNVDNPDSWAAKLVLESEPRWMRDFFLCDREASQARLLERLRDDQPEVGGRTIEVAQADFNTYVDAVLATDKIREKTATFCLLDQRTFECNWETVKKVAKRKSERKIEIFYFVPTGWLGRSISALSNSESTMNRWWGRDDWERLQNMRNFDIVELFRQRFISELGYSSAFGWPIYERSDSQHVMYYMVHATDHDEAPNLMSRAYRTATKRVEPREQFQLEFENWAEIHGRTIESNPPPD